MGGRSARGGRRELQDDDESSQDLVVRVVAGVGGSNSVGEWHSCEAWKRYYVALNEWLDDADFGRLLVDYLEDLGATRVVRRRWVRRVRRGRRRFEAFQRLRRAVDPWGVAWIEWVRARFPVPPGDFEKIGRPGNRPLGTPGESPRRRPVSLVLAILEDEV